MAGIRRLVRRTLRRRVTMAAAALAVAAAVTVPYAVGDRGTDPSVPAVQRPDFDGGPSRPLVHESMNGAHLIASGQGGVLIGDAASDVVVQATVGDTGALGWSFGCWTEWQFEFTFLVNGHEVMQGFCGPGSPFENRLMLPPVTDADAARGWWRSLGVNPEQHSEFRLRVDVRSHLGAPDYDSNPMAAIGLYDGAALVPADGDSGQPTGVGDSLGRVTFGRPTVFSGIVDDGSGELLVVLEPGADPDSWLERLRQVAGPDGWRLVQAPRSARWLESRVALAHLQMSYGWFSTVERLQPHLVEGVVVVDGEVSSEDRARLDNLFDGAVRYDRPTSDN